MNLKQITIASLILSSVSFGASTCIFMKHMLYYIRYYYVCIFIWRKINMNLKQITIASLILSSVSFGASIDLVQNYSAEYAGNPAQQGAINYGSTVYFNPAGDLVQNYSAEYAGNPAQQGAINYGSTVYFNPAGLSQLEQGTYFVGGVQVAFGEQSMAEGKEILTQLDFLN